MISNTPFDTSYIIIGIGAGETAKIVFSQASQQIKGYLMMENLTRKPIYLVALVTNFLQSFVYQDPYKLIKGYLAMKNLIENPSNR